jgi:hypothetical protein
MFSAARVDSLLLQVLASLSLSVHVCGPAARPIGGVGGVPVKTFKMINRQ